MKNSKKKSIKKGRSGVGRSTRDVDNLDSITFGLDQEVLFDRLVKEVATVVCFEFSTKFLLRKIGSKFGTTLSKFSRLCTEVVL